MPKVSVGTFTEKNVRFVRNVKAGLILKGKENKDLTTRTNLLLAIYNGGEEGVLASKKLTELEIKAATKPLIEEIEHKEEVIVGLVDEIDVADKRQILNRVVRYKTKNYKERWNSLYREFDNKYHMDSNRRYHNYKESGQKPKVTGRLDYIDRVMGMIPQLYEIACKLYKSADSTIVDIRKTNSKIHMKSKQPNQRAIPR